MIGDPAIYRVNDDCAIGKFDWVIGD